MSNSEKQENPWLFSRVFNPWRYALNQNSQLLVSEVIDKFTEIETTVPLVSALTIWL